MRQIRATSWTNVSGICAAALLLAGCGHKQRLETVQPVPSTVPPPAPGNDKAAAVATPDLAPGKRLALAADLLDHGEVDRARVELGQLLREAPDDRHAQTLLRSIDADPRELYGPDSYAHQLQADENLVDVARTYMGDLYQFYGLARFNNIVVPSSVTAGQTIMIPGRARIVEPAAPRRAPRPTTANERPASAAAPAAAPAPTIDRGKAQRLRRAGLEKLSAGSADQAVALLGQAAALDPDNGAIRADLARAQRIRSAVRR